MKKENLPTQQSISTEPMPRSQKVFVKGEMNNVMVAMREIETTEWLDEKNHQAGKVKLTVYDTSGAYTDATLQTDIRKGLAPLRSDWIEKRNDTEMLSGFSSHYTNQQLITADLQFQNIPLPRRAKKGMNVSQLHYARKGIITPEMEYIAIRENQNIENWYKQFPDLKFQHAGESFGAKLGKLITPEFVRRLCWDLTKPELSIVQEKLVKLGARPGKCASVIGVIDQNAQIIARITR